MSEYSVISLRRAALQLADISRALRLVWQAAPGWTVALTILLLVQGFLPVATVYLTRPLVNGIVAGVRSGGDWRPILWPAVMMGIVLLLSELLSGVIDWVRTAEAELVQDHITGLIHKKSISADLHLRHQRLGQPEPAIHAVLFHRLAMEIVAGLKPHV